MCMCVCVRVCMCMCVWVGMCLCVGVCMCLRMCVCMLMHMCNWKCMCICMGQGHRHMHVHVRVRVRVRVHVHVHVCVHVRLRAGTPGATMPKAQQAQRLGLRPAWPRAGGARSPEPAHNPAQGTRPSGWGCSQPGHPTNLRKT